MAAINHRQGRPPASSSAKRDRPKKKGVGRSRPYCAVMPPSILNSDPVTNLDSSDAR